MRKNPIKHRVEYTRNKHSRAVIQGDTVVIRLAENLSHEEETEHIEDLLDRMEEHYVQETEKQLIDPFGSLLDRGISSTISLANGTKYVITLLPGEKTSVRKTKAGWTVHVAPGMRRRGLHRLLWRALSKRELPRIERMVNEINAQTYGVHTSQVRLQFATSQWGSCSHRGVIMLNTALLFLPEEVLRYVIIHELAHRKKPDHSPLYWKWVAWAMPNYATVKDELLKYRLPTP